MADIRTRFAPSPTGSLHIGGARTALFNYLFAKKNGGVFVLRIEDTDVERSDPKYEKEILDSFNWLGIAYDEGPGIGGPFGPYRQSERLDTYARHLETLFSIGAAFYCFHSEAELEAERERLLTERKPPIHVCEYRDMPRGAAEKLLGEKPEHIIRFKTPPGRVMRFTDLIRGEISFSSDLIGDFSLAKEPRVPLYNFAVVVDDREMAISHVIRGEEHISNTPRQILIQEALGFAPPIFAHLPLILASDRSKLSKRHGASSVADYRRNGYLPDALVNFIAFLGWNPGGEREIFSLSELVAAFDIADVQKAGAVFNNEKLNWLNGEYIRKKPRQELTELCLPYLRGFLKLEIPNADFPIRYIEEVVALEQQRLKTLSEIGERADYFFRPPEYDPRLLYWKQMDEISLRQSIDNSIELLSKIDSSRPDAETLASVFMPAAERMGDRGALLWPLRVALSGRRESPGPFDILAVLGKDEALQRLRSAREKIASSGGPRQ